MDTNAMAELQAKVNAFQLKIADKPKWKKVLWIIGGVVGLCLCVVPFLVYFFVFKKDNVIHVPVKVDVTGNENQGNTDLDKLEDAVDKGEDILNKIKRAKITVSKSRKKK